ncbi:winged helix-turn-helix transcriptional regulator [Candidatus Woesearchaeota archaeon]|nr:winged helix-turn-helix transcriptional regulator [Candidatus Woesearchaeota archaeon]
MPYIERRITIINMRRPPQSSLNEELQWLGNSLGLFNLRDKNKSCFRIFIELLKAAKSNTPLSSDELALRLGLTRATVIHHIDRLMESGIVIHDGNRYYLRVHNLQILIDELQKDLERTLDGLKEAAREIDDMIGL